MYFNLQFSQAIDHPFQGGTCGYLSRVLDPEIGFGGIMETPESTTRE